MKMRFTVKQLPDVGASVRDTCRFEPTLEDTAGSHAHKVKKMKLPQLHGYPLALAITLALLLKALILFGLWLAFFSAPLARHMRMPTASVEQHLLAPAPAAAPSPPLEGK